MHTIVALRSVPFVLAALLITYLLLTGGSSLAAITEMAGFIVSGSAGVPAGDGFTGGTLSALAKNQQTSTNNSLVDDPDFLIVGRVLDESGVGIPGVLVNAWNGNTRQNVTIRTNENGLYILSLSSGIWAIRPVLSPQMPYRFQAEAKITNVGDARPNDSLNFTLQATNAAVTGRLVDSDGELISGLSGWVEVKPSPKRDLPVLNQSSHYSGAPIVGSRFTRQLPAGDYEISVQLEPNSPFSLPPTQTIIVAPGEMNAITIELSPRKFYLGGILLGNNNQGLVLDIQGDVYGWSGNRVSATSIDETFGGFTLPADLGLWKLSYRLDPSSNYVAIPGRVSSTVGDFHTATLPVPLPVVAKDSRVLGTLVDPENKPVANTIVTARGAGKGLYNVWFHARTDIDGRFEIAIPAGRYWLGTQAHSSAWIQPLEKLVNAPLNKSLEVPTLQFAHPTRILTGTVTLFGLEDLALAETAKTLVRGEIWAWSEAGGSTSVPIRFSESVLNNTATSGTKNAYGIDANNQPVHGEYRLAITANTPWHIRATASTDGQRWRSETTQAPGFAQQRLNIKLADPASVSGRHITSFDPGEAHQIDLVDDTRIYIPAGALAAEGDVTIQVVPSMGLPDQRHVQVAVSGSGYSLIAMDKHGKQIEGPLVHPITVHMPYDSGLLAATSGHTAAGHTAIDEFSLRPAIYRSDSDGWLLQDHFAIDEDADEAAFLLDELAEFTLVALKQIPPNSQSLLTEEPEGIVVTPPEERVGKLEQFYLPTFSTGTQIQGASSKEHRFYLPTISPGVSIQGAQSRQPVHTIYLPVMD